MFNDYLTVRDRVAFADGPFTPSPTWTTISELDKDYASRAEDAEFASGPQRRNGGFEAESTQITVGNRDGRYTPYKNSSPYFPFTAACPFERSVEYPKGSGAWYPIWAGVLKRSNPGFEGGSQGVAKLTFQHRLAKVLKNKLPALVAGQIEKLNPVGFWAMDDLAGSETASDARGEEYPKLAVVTRNAGSVEFGVADAPGPDVGATRVLLDATNNATDGAVLQNLELPATYATDFVGALVFETSGFVAGFWSATIIAGWTDYFGSGYYLRLESDGRVSLQVYQQFVGELALIVTTDVLTPNVAHAITFTVTDTAGTSTIELFVDGESAGTDTFTSWNLGVRRLFLGGQQYGGITFLTAGTYANVAWWNHTETAADIVDLYAKSVAGFPTETADVWFRRITTLAGVPAQWVDTVGTFERQLVLTATAGREFGDVLKELVTAEVGRVSTSPDGKLTLASAATLFEPARTITLSAAEHFTMTGEFDIDSEGGVNDWTGSRVGGGSVRVLADQAIIDDQGQASDTSNDLPLTDDYDVLDVGSWLVNTTSVPMLRIPQIDIPASRLHAAGLLDEWLRLREGDKVTLTGLPASAPVSEITCRLERLNAAFSKDDLRFRPTLTGWVTMAGYEGGAFRLDGHFALDGHHSLDGSAETSDALWAEDTDTVTLQSGIDSDDTSLVAVTAAGSPAFATVVPFDVTIRGERCTVSAVSGDTSPQTLTVTRGVAPSESTVHDAGETVSVFDPGVFGVGGMTYATA